MNQPQACGTGKYRATSGALVVGSCADCVAGKYGSSTAATVCTDCAAGKYAATAAKASCDSCDSTNGNSPTGSSSYTACKCNAGYYGADLTAAAATHTCTVTISPAIEMFCCLLLMRCLAPLAS